MYKCYWSQFGIRLTRLAGRPICHFDPVDRHCQDIAGNICFQYTIKAVILPNNKVHLYNFFCHFNLEINRYCIFKIDETDIGLGHLTIQVSLPCHLNLSTEIEIDI
jgi:hypothetical protein